jgi:hypothetical protein
MAKTVIIISTGRQIIPAIKTLIADHEVISHIEDITSTKAIFSFYDGDYTCYAEIDTTGSAGVAETPLIKIGRGYDSTGKVLTDQHTQTKFLQTTVGASVDLVVSENAIMLRHRIATAMYCIFLGYAQRRNPSETYPAFICGGINNGVSGGVTSFPMQATTTTGMAAVLYDTDGAASKNANCMASYFASGNYDSTMKEVWLRKLTLTRNEVLTEVYATISEISEAQQTAASMPFVNGTRMDFNGKMYKFLTATVSSNSNGFWMLDE